MQKPNFAKWSSASLIAELTEEEKKKIGRPIAGEKPKDLMIRVRVDEDTKNILEEQKKRTGKTMSQIIVELIHSLND